METRREWHCGQSREWHCAAQGVALRARAGHRAPGHRASTPRKEGKGVAPRTPPTRAAEGREWHRHAPRRKGVAPRTAPRRGSGAKFNKKKAGSNECPNPPNTGGVEKAQVWLTCN